MDIGARIAQNLERKKSGRNTFDGSSLVRSSRGSNYVLLEPKLCPARHTLFRPINDLTWFEELTPNSTVALDLETNGVDPSAPDTSVVGIGLASEHGSVYYTNEYYPAVVQWLYDTQCTIIAHNMFFDASWILRDAGGIGAGLNWGHCTYALSKQLATEGWAGQGWGLKQLQKELLLWEVTNEAELDEWLVLNGHYTSTSTSEKEGLVPFKNEAGEQRWGTPAKGMMYLAPEAILGRYCRLDAESTYLLHQHVLMPALRRFPALEEFMQPGRYTHYILQLIHQKLRGIRVDRQKLARHKSALEAEITRLDAEFVSHPLVAPHIKAYNDYQVELRRQKEPKRFKKNGQESRNYVKWLAEVGEMQRDADAGVRRPEFFNINSGLQKQWLFYECLGNAVVKRTESGQPAVDGDALRAFGEPGRLLIEQNDAVKELGYVEQMLNLSSHDGRIHHGFRIPGTLTGRLSGKDPNLQQVPKSIPFLECFLPDDGNVLVQFDFSAIEQVVLAELSLDDSLWEIYGPNAVQQDVYLFNGAHMPGIGDIIRASGYDPRNPTPESIAHAKKVCKRERQIAKMCSLAYAYGASWKKVQAILRLSNIHISDAESQAMHAAYWALYSGVKRYQRELEREHRDRDGWIVNGIGRPLGVHHEYTHDILNRQCQSTGHDLLVLFLHIVQDELDKEGLVWEPYVLDFHDELIIECSAATASKVCAVIDQALVKLNTEVGCTIPLKGEATIHMNLASIKCEGYVQEKAV